MALKGRGALTTLVMALTMAVLALSSRFQIYDSNLYLLSEVPNLLAGDHPYRDFFNWGAPLAAYLSAAGQIVSGYRLIGEFLMQWLFIAAGTAIACHLGLRLSRSRTAALIMLAPVLLLLSNTPTYHYSKLFFFPLILQVCWRYLDRPTAGRGAAVGAVTAIGFLFRHDYAIYLGLASVATFALVRITVPASRSAGAMSRDAAVYALTIIVLLAPWAVVVQANEGLFDYTRVRAAMFESPGNTPVYAALLDINPRRDLLPAPAPVRAGVIAFVWNRKRVDAATQQELEQRLGLRLLDQRDGQGRLQYAVANVYDVKLLQLDPYINDGNGFEWDRLTEIYYHLPTRDSVALWLEQMTLLVPLLLGIVAAWRWRQRHADTSHVALAAIFLFVVDSTLFRQPSYLVTVAPLSFSLSAHFLVARRASVRCAAIALLLPTLWAAGVWTQGLLLRPAALAESARIGFAQLLASPPESDSGNIRYLRACTGPGDRLLITGPTPYDVSYYTQRPMAGGHLLWLYGWRSDPQHEEASLALLERQSVPFAYSTDNPVLQSFTRYPNIRRYLETNYRAVEGTDGRVLIDTRRQPSGTFENTGYPCFAAPTTATVVSGPSA